MRTNEQLMYKKRTAAVERLLERLRLSDKKFENHSLRYNAWVVVLERFVCEGYVSDIYIYMYNVRVIC